MRDYSKVGPKFWIGKTGKKLRTAGMEAQIVAMYLMTSPHANMLGLYYVTMGSIAHETGLGMEGAYKGLRSCIESGYCSFDEETEMVWVYEMASYQIAEVLEVKDLRCKGVQNEYNSLPDNPFLESFFDKYGSCFHMTKKRSHVLEIEAPSKPLRSQEQEQEHKQEQEQEHKQEQEQLAPAGANAGKKSSAPKEEPNPLNIETWNFYKQAYTHRYGVAPVRDVAVNSKIKAIVRSLGAEAPAVAEFFVSHNGSRYVAGMHQIGFLATDYAKLRTEWATNTKMTQTKALQADKTATNLDAFAPLIAAAKAREEAERTTNAE